MSGATTADPYIAAHCFPSEHDDEILGDPLKPATTVMFRIQGQATNHCYDLFNWGPVIRTEAEKGAYIWIPNKRSDGTYSWPDSGKRAWMPVIKLPRAFIYVQTIPQLLLRFTTFFIAKMGKTSYSTPFGMSALHAVDEDIYTAFPINRSALVKGDFNVKFDGPGYAFEPTLEDVRNGKLRPNTRVALMANGAFVEINTVTGDTYTYYQPDGFPLPDEPKAPEEVKEREEKGPAPPAARAPMSAAEAMAAIEAAASGVASAAHAAAPSRPTLHPPAAARGPMSAAEAMAAIEAATSGVASAVHAAAPSRPIPPYPGQALMLNHLADIETEVMNATLGVDIATPWHNAVRVARAWVNGEVEVRIDGIWIRVPQVIRVGVGDTNQLQSHHWSIRRVRSGVGVGGGLTIQVKAQYMPQREGGDDVPATAFRAPGLSGMAHGSVTRGSTNGDYEVFMEQVEFTTSLAVPGAPLTPSVAHPEPPASYPGQQVMLDRLSEIRIAINGSSMELEMRAEWSRALRLAEGWVRGQVEVDSVDGVRRVERVRDIGIGATNLIIIPYEWNVQDVLAGQPDQVNVELPVDSAHPWHFSGRELRFRAPGFTGRFNPVTDVDEGVLLEVPMERVQFTASEATPAPAPAPAPSAPAFPGSPLLALERRYRAAVYRAVDDGKINLLQRDRWTRRLDVIGAFIVGDVTITRPDGTQTPLVPASDVSLDLGEGLEEWWTRIGPLAPLENPPETATIEIPQDQSPWPEDTAIGTRARWDTESEHGFLELGTSIMEDDAEVRYLTVLFGTMRRG